MIKFSNKNEFSTFSKNENKRNIMKIDHLAIWCRELKKQKSFYTHYFGFKAGNRYQNIKKGFSSYFLSLEDGVRIELMHREDIKEEAPKGYYFGMAHIAISVGSRKKVSELTEQIGKDGYEIIGQPRTTGDGYYESVISDPEGNRIEITE